ncbi:DUF3617 domain-containing protein [Aurantiacibacter sediminis]|uniref:DUF3617 family protein n=1 Tax=Aurantiacibacter sediminis TaxID=2793064 RepID=A0ABS0N251_9SPHN|nr:DUF3617 family protein [Aurantiacibacter sediminis]MBH5322041.1 DUF3617 family protein [Aurantiacibacter sediminis]
MKYVAEMILPMAAVVAVPAFAFSTSNQDITAEAGGDEEPDFPWPDFLDVTPLPGAYELEMRVTDVQFPDSPEMAFMSEILMNEVPEVENYCLTGEPERVDWVNEFMDGDCTGSEPQMDGNSFTQVLQCQESNDGPPEMMINLSAEASDQGMDLDMSILMRDQEIGKMRMAMEIDLRRTGDCE